MLPTCSRQFSSTSQLITHHRFWPDSVWPVGRCGRDAPITSNVIILVGFGGFGLILDRRVGDSQDVQAYRQFDRLKPSIFKKKFNRRQQRERRGKLCADHAGVRAGRAKAGQNTPLVRSELELLPSKGPALLCEPCRLQAGGTLIRS